MDTFDLRKFLAESRQPIQEMDAPMEVEAPTEGETMEEIVAEYVTEALQGQDIKEVTGIIERTCNKAMYEMKMEVIAEVLAAYEGRLSEIKGSQYFKEMADEAKVGAQEGMIKGLHEMAMAVKEEYKKAYMPEEVKEEEPKKEEKEDKKGDKEEKEEK